VQVHNRSCQKTDRGKASSKQPFSVTEEEICERESEIASSQLLAMTKNLVAAVIARASSRSNLALLRYSGFRNRGSYERLALSLQAHGYGL